MCQCYDINVREEICDSLCEKTKTTTKIDQDGMMTLNDPVTNTTKKFDPSTVEGYYGNF